MNFRVLLLVPLLILFACTSSQETPQEATTDTPPGLPTEVVELTHPDLAGLEPKALQDTEAQKQALQTALADTSDTAKISEAWGRMGMLYYAYSFREAAETCFRNAHVLQPNNFLWLYYLGNLYLSDNQPETARFFLEQAHQRKGDAPAIKIRLARALQTDNELDRAKTLFEEALALSETAVCAHQGLGQIASDTGRHEDAVTHFGAVLAMQARASAVHYPLALAYQALGKNEEAEKHLLLRGPVEPFLDDPFMEQINRPRAETHYRMAETLRLTMHFQEAAGHYDLVVDLEPTQPGPRLGRALNLVRLGEHYQAVLRLQDDITVFPNFFQLQHILARLWAASPDERIRDPKRSLTMLNTLQQQIGRTAELTETLGMAFAALGRFDDAVLAQEAALKLAKEQEDEVYVAKLTAGLEAYQNQQAPQKPWPEDDPLFKLVTYGR